MNSTTASTTEFLDLPDGRLAYDDTGDGPLIVATPAMLDLRSELRFLVPLHREAQARLGNVAVPSLVIMGTEDVDWPADRRVRRPSSVRKSSNDRSTREQAASYPRRAWPHPTPRMAVRPAAGGHRHCRVVC